MENTTKRRLKWSWVFHAEPMAACGTEPERYKCVCEVSSTDPYEVFGLTNVHRDDESLHWTDNREVAVWAEPLRSTSVGDLVVTSEGRAWMVEHCGFTAFDLGPLPLARKWLFLMHEKFHREGRLDIPVSLPITRARLSDA